MKRLKNERGMTILMALLLVLTATVVSAVILSAALSAARRVNSDRTAQQSYLAVSSAAELLRDSIRTQEYVKIVKKVTTYDEKGEPNGIHTITTETKPGEMGLMGDWLVAGIKENSCTDTITIKLQDEKLPPVKAVFTMSGKGEGNQGYDVRIALAPGGTPDAADDCRMTLKLRGKYRYELDSGYSDQTIEKTTIWWEYPTITKGTGESK